MKQMVDLKALSRRVDNAVVPVLRGRITSAKEVGLEADLPGAHVGMRVLVERPEGSPLPAEVLSSVGARVCLLPLDVSTGVGPGDAVVAVEGEDVVPSGNGLLGRIVDPLGNPLDGGSLFVDTELWPLNRRAPNPLTRPPIDKPLITGIRAIDGCLSLGLGQRIGLFAGPGLGKTTLLGTLARRAHSDVSVICLVGERGREVKQFIDQHLGSHGLARSVVVLAAQDAPLLVRARALVTATALAEWFRQAGNDVLLLVDSLTRAVRARRDVALALGEAPARGGFPASSFTSLPSLLERTGRDTHGSITAIYAVLTEGGLDDPVAEEARSLLDGHIVLSSKLARAGRWPAIDVVRSVSRVADDVASPKHRDAANKLKRLLGAHEENEDLILMGAYRQGTSRDTDIAMERQVQIKAFLEQRDDSASPIEATISAIQALVSGI